MTGKTQKTCLSCSLLLGFMLFFQSLTAQDDFSSLTNLIKKNEKTLGKDYAVVVQKQGKPVFLKETEEFKMKTPAPVGSGSQWFTVALIMILVDEGKIKLDDPVAKYVPVFGKYMKGYITIRHCISQTTGLDTDPVGILKLAQKTRFASLEEEMEAYAAKKLIVDNPGNAFAFGNVGLNMAARVAEVVTKKTFDRVITEKLFRPLGMRSASFYNETGDAPNPSAGAVCSAYDYINFMQMILNKGVFNGKRVMSENALKEMFTSQLSDAKQRYIPEMAKGYAYVPGCWITETNADGSPAVYSAIGMYGTWAWMDVKNAVCGVVMVREMNDNRKRELYLQIISAANDGLGLN